MSFSQDIPISDVSGLNVSIVRFYRGHPRSGNGLKAPASHYLTVWWLHRGSASVSTEDAKPVILQPDDVFICKPGVHRVQQFSSTAQITSIWFRVDWGTRMQPLIEGLPICFDIDDHEEMRQCCDQTTSILESHGKTPQYFLDQRSLPFEMAMELRCLGFQFYQMLLRAMRENGCQLRWMEHLDPRVRRAIKHLNQLHSPIAVPYEELAGITKLGRVQLDRLFKEDLGMTPKKYLANQCFGEVTDLLEHTKMSISDIADGFGFSSTAHFCAWFKRQTGTTPLEHRKLHTAEYHQD